MFSKLIHATKSADLVLGVVDYVTKDLLLVVLKTRMTNAEVYSIMKLHKSNLLLSSKLWPYYITIP